ncbi:cyclic nucleotide-binding domain-containing protein [Leadbettera azotonutricia]|uniref:Cyclic nucleotide-binding protein n=1 Tax=Leadbettera azotonutricia (strain ATCC BAA-888 / DSM 13862 / ZAS-9) TaxID=545695 RepID=F5YE14_LEAAZ|nr:cyclic nucleotide-binding domain-containing protein [Leadbettera azotonutricia]AEF82410.1 cyclic nucleotide-binding protein [Leadbettera azotonutricia ZAS-9]
MPKPLQYRSGSLIYFQGDPANQVFILQKGQVNLVYQDIETGQDVHDLVQPGEFFGVKSALGRYPREENAVALMDASIMAFTVPEFEALAMANTRIVMKMLKVFSNQMRRIHHQVSNLMEKDELLSPEAGLFNVGQYYLKNKRFAQAKYVLSRYLTYYPSGRNAVQAAKDLEVAEIAIARGGGGDKASVFAAPGSAASSSSESLTDTAKLYYDAVSLISQQKYQQAYLGFKKIVDANEDAEYSAKSSFEIGRCLFLLNKFEDCIKYYTMMITRYPKHPDLGDALFFMGQSYEKNNRKDQAATFYKKILSMPGDEDDGTHIKARRALKALEE